MNEEKELRTIYDSLENKRGILNILRSEKYAHLVDFLNNRYPMLSNKKYTLGMKLYWFIHGIEDFPKCIECGKPNKTHRCRLEGYQTEYCSRKCAAGKTRQSRMEKTSLERYGTRNPLQNESIKEKQTATLIKKYGVKNVSFLQSTVDKISQTKLERYGDKFYVNKEKSKKTNLERYGVENPFELQETQDKAKDTMLKKYGVEHAMQVPEIHDKVVKNSTRFHIHNSYANYLMVNPYSEPAFTEEYYINNRSRTMNYNFRCRKCGKIYKSRINNGRIRRCPDCYSSVTTSGKEQEIFDFMISIYDGEIIRKDRSILGDGRELDIVIPERNLAIEFDGLYWHSELNGIEKDYHLENTVKCEEKGYQLIHIFEDEWDKKQHIVKSRLSRLLGSNTTRIFARKCKIVDVDSSVEMEFLEQNHIQGKIRSSYCYGLEHNGELVALMSFSKPRIALGRKGKEGEYELLRFCSKLGYQVIDGAGKLLKHFEEIVKPSNLVSYADRRWSVGKVYKSLGFDLSHISPPNYWYLNNGCYERFHRFTFRKSVLKNKLKKFDENLTEAENMRRNKYTRIWDCGNLVFVKQYKKDEE